MRTKLKLLASLHVHVWEENLLAPMTGSLDDWMALIYQSQSLNKNCTSVSQFIIEVLSLDQMDFCKLDCSNVLINVNIDADMASQVNNTNGFLMFLLSFWVCSVLLFIALCITWRTRNLFIEQDTKYVINNIISYSKFNFNQ